MSEPFKHVKHSYCDDLKELMQEPSHASLNSIILARLSEHTFTKYVACCPSEVPPEPPRVVKVSQPPLPTQGDWTNLFQAAKNFCPCNMAGHRCAGLYLCDKTRICNQAKNRRRILHHLHSSQPRCEIPERHHIMATCGYVKRGEPCPDFIVGNCLYGHDHIETRLQLWTEHKAHHDYFHWKTDSQRN